MLAMKLLSVLVLLLASTGQVSAKSLNNAERLARGMSVAKPKRLFDPTRVQHAKRSAAPLPPSARIGVSSVVIPFSPGKREVVSARDLKRQAQKQAIAARQGSTSLPVFTEWLAPASGVTPATVTTVGTPDAAAIVDYTLSGETALSMSSGANTFYISTCCTSSRFCFISPNDGSALSLSWTGVAAPAGYYPGGPNPPTGGGICQYMESTFFTVDPTTGEISIQYLNPTSASFYNPQYTIPPEETETYIVQYGSSFYLTGDPVAFARPLGGGASLVTFYVDYLSL